MMRARIHYWVDVAALAGALLVFPTGLILLARFHIGPDGAHRLAVLGLSRGVWLHLHQFAAVVMTVAVTIHVELHWRAIAARVKRSFRQLTGPGMCSDLALYFGFATVTSAAFAAWLVLPAYLHHPAIDLHNLSNLMLLPGAVLHVRRHYRWLIRNLGD